MYEIEWLDAALNELAAVWVGADSSTRGAIRSAVAAVETRLRRDPSSQGESREGDERVLFAEPLGLSVDIDNARRTVTVLHVWRVRRR